MIKKLRRVVLDRGVLEQGFSKKKDKMQATSRGENFLLLSCALRDFSFIFNAQDKKRYSATMLCLKCVNIFPSWTVCIHSCKWFTNALVDEKDSCLQCPVISPENPSFLLTGKLIIPVVSKTATCVGTSPSAKCIDRRRAEIFRIYPFVLTLL